MAVFNGSQQFREGRRKTRAVSEIPRSVREALNIADICPNGIFKIEPGNGKCMYDTCYLFEDINYIKLDNGDKRSILLKLMAWLNSMGTDFKITLANEFRDMEAYLQELFAGVHREEYPLLAEGVDQWKRSRLKEGTPQIRTLRCLTVTCYAESRQEAQIYFNVLDESIRRMFAGWKSRIRKLETRERLRLLHAFLHAGQKTPFYYHDGRDSKSMWKHAVMPSDIRSFSNFMILHDVYLSVLVATGYEETLDEEKVISSLSRVNYPSYVTIDYAPVKRQALRGKLEAAYMNNEKAIADEMNRNRKAGMAGAGISYSKGKKRDELEGYRDQISDNDESCFFVGLLAAVTADSEEELAVRVEQMIRIGAENGVRLETYNYRQLKALNTLLPFGGRQVDIMTPMLTSSVVALQPYYAQELQEKGGHVYGTNRTTKNLISGRRKGLMNPHGLIVGHTGSGKSFYIKLTEVIQTLLGSDDDIIIIDPQNEFRDSIQLLGGEFFDLTPKSRLHFNPLEIPETLFHAGETEQEKFIAVQAEYLKSFCTAVMKNILVTQEHYSIIDQCTRELCHRALRKKGKQVTLIEFRKELLKRAERNTGRMQALTEQISNSLEEFTEGSCDMFAHLSNVSIRNRCTVFGLKNVSDKLWEPAMITIMHFLANRMEYNRKNQRATHLIVDETQVVCENKTSAEELLRAVVTFRKFGGIVTMAMQNVTRALENPDLRDMFSNCGYKCFFDQGGVDARELAAIQEFSEEEFLALSEERPGCGVMVWGKKVLLLDAYMEHENPIYPILNTNFHEKAEKRKRMPEERNVPESGTGTEESGRIDVPESGTETEEPERTDHVESDVVLREGIRELAALSSITAEDVEDVFLAESQAVKRVLEEMCREGELCRREFAGKIQFRLKQ